VIRAVAGWMLVQPLSAQSANELLRVGRVHSIGELPDPEMTQRLPFGPGDRVAWIDGEGRVFEVNDTLLAVSLNAPIVYELARDFDHQRNGAHMSQTPDIGVEPGPEPDHERSDPHQPPLDDDEDARYLDPADPRRLDVERRRGRPFREGES
jgi:hypothetical protein